MKVNEIFGPTIQGEGKSIGKETMFLRLAMCNLACIWCDEPQTWNYKGTRFQHPEKYIRDFEIHVLSCEQVLDEIRKKGPNVKSLVISGGEPMLQQAELIELLKLLKRDDYWVEVETNGTIVPSDEFLELVDQINCSPKTSNSGPDNPLQKRERPNALMKLAGSQKTNFKFVVESENDMAEVNGFIEKYALRNVNVRKLFLMPQSKNRAEYLMRWEGVRRLAVQNKMDFSQRLQIERFDGRRGF